MAKLYIKKHRLIAGGKRYEAGAVVNLPDAEALKLAKDSPDEFEVLAAPVSNANDKEAVSEKMEEETPKGIGNNPDLSKLKLSELKQMCDRMGIAYKSRDTKDTLIAALESADAEQEGEEELIDGLPPIDIAGLVK